jgi:hypothetical protein
MARATKGILRFRTLEQATLFEMEISGQLSDGHWENHEPHQHWQPWCDAKIEVGPNVGRDFNVYEGGDDYDLTDSSLMGVVGYRMRVFVRFARRHGLEKAKILEGALDLDGMFRGLPSEAQRAEKTRYWRDLYDRLLPFDMDEVRALAESEEYTHEELLADLREMRGAMRTWVGVGSDHRKYGSYWDEDEDDEPSYWPGDDDDCCGGSCPDCPY